MKKRIILEESDLNILDEANKIITAMRGEDVEFASEELKLEMETTLYRIVDNTLNLVNLNMFDEEVEEEEEDDGEPYGWCELCGKPIYDNDPEWFAADGSLCCCDDCVVEYNAVNFLEDDEDEDL